MRRIVIGAMCVLALVTTGAGCEKKMTAAAPLASPTAKPVIPPEAQRVPLPVQ